jgi:Folate-dependent phosphoribosylglycinamide formyltransferase PurN
MSRDLSALLLPGKYDLVCMAGFLSRYFIPPELAGKVVNIHPALIPMFSGQGMYGHHVHEAVIRSGVRVTGCTVHFADNDYDTGPIILQRACPVYTDDTADTVAARVFLEEKKAYPEAVNLIAENRIGISPAGRVIVERDREVARCSHDD